MAAAHDLLPSSRRSFIFYKFSVSMAFSLVGLAFLLPLFHFLFVCLLVFLFPRSAEFFIFY